MTMTRLAAAMGLVLLLGAGAVPAADTTAPAGAGATTPGSGAAQANAPSEGLGFDISEAGTTAADHKAYFSSRSAEQQAQIRQRCEAVTTTGSVANSDTPMAGTTAEMRGAATQEGAATASVGAKVMTFCDAIKR
jgi:hypothetical protein